MKLTKKLFFYSIQFLILASASMFFGCSTTQTPPITETTTIESAPGTIRLKVRDQKVASVQEALNAFGANLTVDGIMGQKTKQALRTYQQESGLLITGYPDKATLRKLDIKE